MFDTHAHLDMLADPPADVLGRAQARGVTRILTAGTTAEANAFAIAAARAHRGSICAAVGYDRNEAAPDNNLPAMADSLETHIRNGAPEIVAIGETGLDFHYRKETAEAQKALFEMQLGLAEQYRLPVIIHCREAESEVVDCLKRHPAVTGVIHCFTGSTAFATTVLDLGMMISFSGILTFRNAQSLRDTAGMVPEDMLLVETDSPYLAPEPHRGQKNEPALLPATVKCLAGARGNSPEEIARITEANARRLFRV
jgi:TatD DNase family protein